MIKMLQYFLTEKYDMPLSSTKKSKNIEPYLNVGAGSVRS